jgi:hypothetical protein
MCEVDGCKRPVRSKGSTLCGLHYQRLRKHGTTADKPRPQLGDVFGMLTLVEDRGMAKGGRQAVFRCECGGLTKPTRISSVERGYQKSCGCLREAADRGTCSVAGCEDPVRHLVHGLCHAHHRRRVKYGDPAAGGIRHGEPQRFACEVVESDTDACIPWPHCTTIDGYGRINVDGTTIGAHVHVATLAHGPKPSAEHECCHSCGNGHLGCVNPRHLYWGTRSDNVQDMIRHGTIYRGGSPGRRLTARA